MSTIQKQPPGIGEGLTTFCKMLTIYVQNHQIHCRKFPGMSFSQNTKKSNVKNHPEKRGGKTNVKNQSEFGVLGYWGGLGGYWGYIGGFPDIDIHRGAQWMRKKCSCRLPGLRPD